MRRFLCTVAALALASSVSSTSWGDGVVRDGIGAVPIGRGGTNLGFADNGAIILDNPAAMTNIAGCNLLDIGLDTVLCNVNYADAENNVDSAVRAYPAGMFGYVGRIPDSRWAWGIGGYAPAGFGAKFNMTNADVGGPTEYKSLGMLGKLLPGVAYQVTDRLSIGGTLGIAVCHAELEGPFYAQQPPFAGGPPTILDLQHTGVAPTGGVGLQYKVTPSTTIGIAYTEETRFDFDGTANVTFFTPFGQLNSEFDAQTNLVWPRSLGIGINHELCCCQRVAFDVLWYDWSSAFSQMDITLSNPSDPFIAALVGTEIRDSLPMNWRDSVSYRFGYEWDATDRLTGRLGYIYHKSPVPDSTLNPYLDGILEHAFSAGLGYRLQGGAWLNLAYSYSFGPEREVGTSGLIGGDFSNSKLYADAHWASVGLLWQY